MSILEVAIQNMLGHENVLDGDTTPIKPHIKAWQKQIADRIAFSRFMLSLELPLTHSLVPSLALGSPTATFTRATTGSVQDHEDVLRTAIAGEARFTGARRVRNLLPSTEGTFDAGAGWTVLNGTVKPNVSDPNGGTSAYTLRQTGASSCELYPTTPFSGSVLSSVWLRRRTGTGAIYLYGGDTETNITDSVTSEWQRIPSHPTNSSAVGFDLRLFDANDEVDFWRPQAEDITGRADPEEPSEYVSVGVLSAPYHGAGVDGVKYFDTDLSGDPLPTSATYDAVWLNGVAGTYVSTPDSVAASITGDIDIRVKAALTDWTPATYMTFVEKLLTGGQYSYDFRVVATTGYLTFRYSTDGTVIKIATSSVAPTVSDGAALWARCTLSVSSGDVVFYTSTDGSTWTQLGTTQSTASGAIFNGNTAVYVGASAAGTPLNGKIHQAQIYNGIDGTLAVDFDASRYAGGTTLTGSTGETWTLQGSAYIPATNYPLRGYLAEGARTNLCLQSNAFTTTWAAISAPAITQNVVGPDGATSAWTLTDDSAIAWEGIRQGIALTAATHTISLFVKKTTGAQASYPVIYTDDGVSKSASCTIDTSNGVATVWTAYTGNTVVTSSASCISHNADFWRVSLVLLATAATWNVYLIPAGATSATQSTGIITVAAQGSAVFYGAQVELGSFASSYIPTTTVAVARNADVLTYSSSGNISTVNGWAYAEVTSNTVAGQQVDMLDLVASGNPFIPMLINSSNKFALLDPSISTRPFNAAPTRPISTSAKFSSTWSASGTTGTFNGAAPPALQTYTTGAVTNAIAIGGRVDGTVSIFGTIRNVRIGQRQLSSSELRSITA